ncbi:MAG TPA: GGDEF domain-containing protein [Desulfuromonadales bacterium]|nr:GGDEF domain-containing protein [Desulfuromonadales bacterium]
MNLYQLLNIKTQNDPDSLLRLLTIVALISIITVVTLGSYGFYQVFSGFVIKSAEVDSVQLCRVLINEQKDLMFVTPPGKKVEIGLHGTEILPFDNRLRAFLAPFNIIKVKIYNPAKQIVYSTDPTLIGKVDSNNRRLAHALSGAVDAKLVTKDKASDLADETLRDVDVVETYVPIVSSDSRIVGSFEIYMNVTQYRAQISHGVRLATSLLGLVMVVVFGFSYVLIRGGTDRLKAAQSQLNIIAITDSLTGIPNRGQLMLRGEEEFERIQRAHNGQRMPLGCIMLDIDHFKQVNDTKGHLAGDQILHGVAQRLKSCLRPYDLIGRYGGEEFVILLPDTALEHSLLVANRLLERMRREPFEAVGLQLSITASLGVTISSETDSSLADIIKRADEAMYKAKKSGRDRVAWMYDPFDAEIHS